MLRGTVSSQPTQEKLTLKLLSPVWPNHNLMGITPYYISFLNISLDE